MTTEWFDHPEYQELEEKLFAHADDSWDDDASSMSILEDFVGHMADEVKRLGGCLRRHCRWDDREPCDHGYLPVGVGFYIDSEGRRAARGSTEGPQPANEEKP